MFTNKKDWCWVTNEQKEQFFFIFNRYFSRKYPNLSQLVNHKLIDKSVGMDLWFEFMKNKPYPQWFWSKTKKTSKQNKDENLYEELRQSLNITETEFDFLSEYYPQELEEEINYIKQKNGSTREKMVHSKSTK